MTYIEAIRDAIRHLHGCDSRHIESVPVHEEFQGETVWSGIVEVFELLGHPQAKKCYAWGFTDDLGKGQYIAVLDASPVDSPRKAVQAYILTICQGKATP